MAEEKSYRVQGLGTPCNFIFPRIVEKGEVISVGRPSVEVNNGDVIKLDPFFANKLIKQGKLLEIKEKAVK